MSGDRQELFNLIALACDNDLQPDQLARLEELLHGDKERNSFTWAICRPMRPCVGNSAMRRRLCGGRLPTFLGRRPTHCRATAQRRLSWASSATLAGRAGATPPIARHSSSRSPCCCFR